MLNYGRYYMKKIILFLSAFLLIFTACANNTDELPVSTASTVALPEDEKKSESVSDGTLTYDIYQTYAEVTGYLTETTEILIPPVMNDLPVMSVAKDAFAFNDYITKVTLPYTITNIANYAFNRASNLKEINFPDGLISVGNYSFRGTKLSTIELPATLTNIGKYAFAETLITHIKIPDNIVKMQDYIFYGCPNLVSFEFPITMHTIPKRMFYSCPSLTEVTIPDMITKIDDYAFSTCQNLTSIIIPTTVTEFGEGVFYNCSSIVIKTTSGSAAEKYAIKYKINYEIIEIGF